MGVVGAQEVLPAEDMLHHGMQAWMEDHVAEHLSLVEQENDELLAVRQPAGDAALPLRLALLE